MDFSKVSHSEFQKFIEEYPRPLTVDVCGICEPPLISYNDFTENQKWPESMVAKYHDSHPRQYWVRHGLQ